MKTPFARLETCCRYFICLLMLVYGIVKLFHGQFYTDEYWKDTPLGQLTGFELAWSFHSHSAIYETILGLVEVIIGLLVFFRRTTRLGVIMFIPVMTNLVLINIFFEIGALPPAIALWLAGVVLLLLHFQSLKRDLWDRHDSLPPTRTARALPQASVIILGCALAAVILYNNKIRFRPDPRICGTWQFTADGPLQRVYFEKGQTCVIKDKAGDLHFAHYRTEANKLLTVTHDESRLNWRQAPYHIENGSLVIAADSGRQVLTPKAVNK
jgi:hypothetical protein